MARRLYADIPDADVIKAVNESSTLREVLRKLKMNSGGTATRRLRKRAENLGLDLGVFNRRVGKQGCDIALDSLLVENSRGYKTGPQNLIWRLLKENIFTNRCDKCGLEPKWLGSPLRMRLFFKNGVTNDMRLENLRLVCPNCHAQLTADLRAKRHKKDDKKDEAA